MFANNSSGGPWLCQQAALGHGAMSTHAKSSSSTAGSLAVPLGPEGPPSNTAGAFSALLGHEGPPSNTLRYRGLGWDRKFGCWRVRIFFNGRQRHVGRFRDPLTAARAYNKVVTFLYGDKAILNIVPDGDAATDTFDIPFAIRQAKLEAQCTTTTSDYSNSSTTSSAPSFTSASSTTSMQQMGAPRQLQDLLLPMTGSSLLPLSCGLSSADASWLQLAVDSSMDSPLFANNLAAGQVASTGCMAPCAGSGAPQDACGLASSVPADVIPICAGQVLGVSSSACLQLLDSPWDISFLQPQPAAPFGVLGSSSLQGRILLAGTEPLSCTPVTSFGPGPALAAMSGGGPGPSLGLVTSSGTAFYPDIACSVPSLQHCTMHGGLQQAGGALLAAQPLQLAQLPMQGPFIIAGQQQVGVLRAGVQPQTLVASNGTTFVFAPAPPA